MSGSFSNINNDNLTSNAYTIRKKNINLFCDISKNSNTKVSKSKNGVLKTTNNHESLIGITHGFYDYYQKVDISNHLLSSPYDSQTIKDDSCVKYPNLNGDISNNYVVGSFLTSYSSGLQTVQDDNVYFKDEYGEIRKVNMPNDNQLFPNMSKLKRTKCFKMHDVISKKN
tara:strand:+ start:6026 stop:6535 length:510 start_codon:yes stop_codon:yes gene_type:complete